MRPFLILLIFSPFFVYGQTPNEVLEKAVDYHDPEGKWKTLKATFTYKETRPDGEDRKTILELKNGANWHKLNRNDEEVYVVNGKGDVEILKGDGDEARGKLLRNYYVFLWGLPMKLLDRGTPIQSELENKKIKGVNCFGVVVTYEKETYTFFFAKDNFRMVAYQFFKNDDSGKGEMIHLEEEVSAQGIRIPKKRAWYELPQNKYLGTDILERVE